MNARSQADQIYDRVYRAVLEQRLAPGAKLTEERLASIFSVSRAPVRQALARLEHERIVVQIPNRGAFVARPSASESDDVLDARRLIEPALVRRLASDPIPTAMASLRRHVASEHQAHSDGDDGNAIRLSGEFHNLLADLAGNAALAHTMRQLSALTCLVILVHHAPTASACRPDEHSLIVEHIAAGDASRAAAAVTKHLDNVQAVLVFSEEGPGEELEAVFADASPIR